ncbi:SO_0444 family Cu/Zn efflux transporter [Duncaniella muris]|uniref:SO_0444 family Cu/Zn efflux transporter n=1 Tax=Duncaniella muris TaxID=2094150 RepID=UPI0027152908|nr:SO_0444 family Cu/Zn efflux transporter [Duncaniella muris]
MNFSHFFTSLIAIVNEMSPYIILGFIIAGFLHVFIRPDTMGRHLAGRGIKPVMKAALLGIPLPLCSCGVLPTAVSLRRQGASKGATTSFLIATPQTGVDSIAATYSLLGLPFAILRPVGALAGALLGGVAVGRLDSDSQSGSETACHSTAGGHEHSDAGFVKKIIEAVRYGLVDMVGSVGKWLVIGLIVAALITVLVPDELFLGLSQYPLLAMLVMVVVSVPMYICATGSIPIALSLIAKGLTPGVGFVLLMAGPAANFASMIILSKTIGRKSTYIYVGSVVLTAILFGLAIDYLLPREWFMPSVSHLSPHCHHTFGIFESMCSLLLLCLLVYSGIRQHNCKIDHQHNLNTNASNMKQVYIIEGMSCSHCQASVKKAILNLKGVQSVTVDLGSGEAVVEGDVDANTVREAIYEAGFSVKE